jgi:DNA repair protein RadA/Sms
MAKAKVHFLCNHCGSVHPKWMGKCPDCGTWDSLEEYKEPAHDERAERSGKLAAEAERGIAAAEPIVITDIEEADAPRLRCGIGEFDRILGGGLVPGSAILVGGEPGIGKSTLLLQVANSLAAAASPSPSGRGQGEGGRKVLYVTSEESSRQTALRASRLGASSKNLLVLAETNVERITNQIRKHRPAVVVVDSIQMIYKPQLPAAPGSVTQLRDCCMELVYLAKALGIATLFVGHVTKAGTLAGPKIIEHIVDTVVYFEGDRFHTHRVVRCVKNRFGSTHEVGLFEMTGEGLREVADPGKLFIEQRAAG